jgi:3-oxoacyl-[acyl-carrier protein] reductase
LGSEERPRRPLIALITGSTGGLGRALAEELHRRGWLLALNYKRDEEAVQKLLRSFGPDRAMALRADVGSPQEVRQMARRLKDRWGRLNALINCAGLGLNELLLRTGPDKWDELMRVNLTGCFNVIRACLELLEPPAHVLNIASYVGLKGARGQAAYAASKAAVVGLTKALARELAPRGVRVNAMLPGYMDTPMGRASPEGMRRAQAESLLGRLSEPRQVARSVACLLELEDVTGQVLALESRLL